MGLQYITVHFTWLKISKLPLITDFQAAIFNLSNHNSYSSLFINVYGAISRPIV